MRRKKKRFVPSVLAVVLLLAAGILFYMNQGTVQELGEEKTITVQIVHKDASSCEIEIKTGQEYLGRALVSSGIVEENQGSYGLYILTVDGETADEAEQEWWCLTKNGESLMTGADHTPIADGEHYELTFTIGYE